MRVAARQPQLVTKRYAASRRNGSMVEIVESQRAAIGGRPPGSRTGAFLSSGGGSSTSGGAGSGAEGGVAGGSSGFGSPGSSGAGGVVAKPTVPTARGHAGQRVG